MPDRPSLDARVVCGLIAERGAAARAQKYEHRWEGRAALWRAVRDAIGEAANATPPTTPRDPPPWLEPLVREWLEIMSTSWHHGSFETVRTLERLGLVALPADDTYVLAVVGGLGDRVDGRRADALRADPDLIERAVWRMFEVEGGGEVSLANIDKFSADDAGWRAAFVELTADGTLPRERVLTSCLDALNRDFSAYRAGWYSRLYDALGATPQESARHQARLRGLLRNPVTATVSFAVARLQGVHKHGLLDGPETLPALAPAVVTGPKTTAVAALRLASQVAKQSPQLGDAATDVAATALEHPHADVQRAAAKLLTELGATGRLEAAALFLEPSVRLDLLGERSAPDVEQEAVTAMPAPVRRAFGDDEVVDRLAALLEDASDPFEVELVLAALARLDDHARLRGLTKRATTVLTRGQREGVTAVWLRGQLARLVLAAARVEVPARPHVADDNRLAFLLARLASVEDVVAGKRAPHDLTATPDVAEGWVSAAALIERLQRRPEPPDRHDFVAALLRLHPADRDDARTRAREARGALRGPVAAVVGYALGSAPPRSRRLHDRSWWVAASRARAPVESDEWLAARGVSGAGRSEPIDAKVAFTAEPFSWTDRSGTHDSVYWKWAVEVSNPARHPDADEPTAVAGGATGFPWGSPDAEDFVGSLALIWPHDAEHFLVGAADAVVRAATSTEVSHDAVRVLDALARHPGRLGSLAVTTIAAGLSASKADQRAHAVDAVLQLRATRRLDAEQLAAGLVFFGGPATPTRLATSLRDVASGGLDARDLVIDALAVALPAFEPSRRGIHALLELLREELLRAGRSVPANLRPWLDQFRGSSRASKAATALLAPEGRR